MTPEMRKVMKCKRLALFRRMLQDEKHPDSAIVDDMCRGFDLVGDAPTSSGILPGKFSPAATHVDVLCSEASRSRQAVLATTRSSGDGDMDLKLWQKTLEERDKGWLVGPCDLSKLEVNAVISKRFPLQQGPKLRPIDDYSMSSINSTVGTHEQATTDNVDVIAAMLVNFMQQLYVRDKATAVVARSFGLSSAYHQLCVAESSRAFSYISVFDPTSGRPAVFRQICLPFGSRSAVNAFIRCARCIQWLACRCLSLPT